MIDFTIESSSFRDPSGFLFYQNNVLYRQINKSYKENYNFLIKSGLYANLVEQELLIPHEEVVNESITNDGFIIIKPEKIPFISYPYEWSFSQLKDAALITIEIQKIAKKYDMMLKDASAYNIQFKNGKPIFIDTLSFEKYVEGEPWKGYKQFCQHFFAPLALMSKRDIRLGQLSRIYIDGIPLDLASDLLPMKTKTAFSLLSHIHAHAKSQKYYQGKKIDMKKRKISSRSLEGVIESLHSGIKKMNWAEKETEWGDYYSDTNYSDVSFEEKQKIILEFLKKHNPKQVWDLGSNTGIFSRIASDLGIFTVSFDIDPLAVEKNYRESVEKQETNILPLLLDLANPSGDIGWSNNERLSLMKRGPVDLVMALALIHHLVISNNIPLKKLANFFNKICNFLIIEFIPKTDSQVDRLLVTREDIFTDYTQENFELEFKNYFTILKSIDIIDTKRTMYIMEKKERYEV
jgi:ribosomal protein L11 methylase PrmA|tara:strand:+ start:1505 stop:2893 length:1389 start_codon:yes stop_codon:yes gene_type:complete